jgi:hypothetical protein
MSDLESVSSQIRFHLSQMRAKNQQHELERLAFHLARATITANVAPATGPVQAGGDQGRDFETFRSHLRATDIGESAFAARISDVTIAFACSLEQEIVAKIKEDVGKILGTGTGVARWNAGARVNYFGEVEAGTWTQLDDPTAPPRVYDSRVATDVHFGLELPRNLSLTVGGTNIFDVEPTAQRDRERRPLGKRADGLQRRGLVRAGGVEDAVGFMECGNASYRSYCFYSSCNASRSSLRSCHQARLHQPRLLHEQKQSER